MAPGGSRADGRLRVGRVQLRRSVRPPVRRRLAGAPEDRPDPSRVSVVSFNSQVRARHRRGPDGPEAARAGRGRHPTAPGDGPRGDRAHLLCRSAGASSTIGGPAPVDRSTSAAVVDVLLSPWPIADDRKLTLSPLSSRDGRGRRRWPHRRRRRAAVPVVACIVEGLSTAEAAVALSLTRDEALDGARVHRAPGCSLSRRRDFDAVRAARAAPPRRARPADCTDAAERVAHGTCRATSSTRQRDASLAEARAAASGAHARELQASDHLDPSATRRFVAPIRASTERRVPTSP